MTEEPMNNRVKTKRIAIIGSGISGQTCGYLLSQKHHVTLFEANDYLGGHTATIDTTIDGKQLAVDTGFIVFNDRTYPNFIKIMKQIGVQYKPTEMSFSVRNDINGLEYNGHSLATLFSQRRNILNIKFYRFIAEILRFNKLAKQFDISSVNTGQRTLGSFLDEHGFSDYFSNNYILPMVAAIWSSSIESGRDCPLLFFIQFFNNHGLLDIAKRPQWYVIEGGSRSYIPGLTRDIQQIKINTPVQAVKRNRDHVEVITEHEREVFDEVIFACHSDQALALLKDPSEAEANVLGGIQYRNNDVVLHTDTSLLPKRKKSYASWNYRIDSSLKGLSSVTYNMNILQGLPVDTTLCVTLNQTDKIDPGKILRRFSYAHPVFSLESIMAQQKRADICGHDHTHFCGAYWYNGFHEDGVRSALDVCERFGMNLDSARLNQINADSNMRD
ncbi:MAG: NAD(P)-binding protein [Pseudomonadales bacterium]|nr:NAD(P)-binding protein [Pseudomonadales bacterium]